MRETLPLHLHRGERYQRGDPSSTGQKHRGTNGCGGRTCTYHRPPPAPLHWGAQQGQHRRDTSELPYCPGEQVQRSPPPVPAVQETATYLNRLQPLHYLQASVVVGRHTETASPPPVPVMRTGCTETPILVTLGAPPQAYSSGSAQLPLSSCTGRIHRTQAKSRVLLAALARTGGLV